MLNFVLVDEYGICVFKCKNKFVKYIKFYNTI